MRRISFIEYHLFLYFKLINFLSDLIYFLKVVVYALLSYLVVYFFFHTCRFLSLLHRYREKPSVLCCKIKDLTYNRWPALSNLSLAAGHQVTSWFKWPSSWILLKIQISLIMEKTMIVNSWGLCYVKTKQFPFWHLLAVYLFV